MNGFFEYPMSEHTLYYYEECRAKLLLEHYFNNNYQDLIISDRPDLITNDKSVGVEVTSAIDKKTRESISLYSKLAYVDDDKKQKLLKRIEDNGMMVKDGVLFYGGYSFSYNNENIAEVTLNQYQDIFDAFVKKLAHINDGQYEKCLYYDLFIEYEAPISIDFLEQILKVFVEYNKDKVTRFRYAYITLTNSLVKFDLCSKALNTIDTNNSDVYLLNMKARKIAEGSIKCQN